MPLPDRSSGQKFTDNLFSGVPTNILTSDAGAVLGDVHAIREHLDRHQMSTERALVVSNGPQSAVPYQPQYLGLSEVALNTARIEEGQQDVKAALGDICGAQGELVEITRGHTELFERFVRSQGTSNALLYQGNELTEEQLREQWVSNELLRASNIISVAAYQQRQIQLNRQGMTNDLISRSNELALEAARTAALQHKEHKQLSLEAARTAYMQLSEQKQTNSLLSDGNKLLHHGNQILLATASEAADQRNLMIEHLANLSGQWDGVVDQLAGMEMTVAYEQQATRQLMHKLFSDLGTQVTILTSEQVLSRIQTLQALYSLRSVFMQTHEQEMLTQQAQKKILEGIYERSLLSDNQKESHHQWERAEDNRRQALSPADLEAVLPILKAAYELDDINPLVHLSLGTIQTALGNSEAASVAFATADRLIGSSPHLSSFVLMNLANNLHMMGRHEHAERVMRKATRVDPGNNEVWYNYAKSAWRTGKKANAILIVKKLLALNGEYYSRQLLTDPNLNEFCEELSLHTTP